MDTEAGTRFRLPRPTPAALLPLVPLLLVVARAGGPIVDSSFLWHVRAGAVQAELGKVLTVDPFSLTMSGERWRTQSWLAELGYAQLERWSGGVAWAGILTATVMVLAVGFGWLVARRHTAGFTVTLLVLAVAWTAVAATVPRPAVFGYLMLGMLVAVVDRPERLWWTLPLLLWPWAALHGSFPFGLAVAAVVWLARRPRLSWVPLVAAAAITFVTAHGVGAWTTVVGFVRSREALSLIDEWRVLPLWRPEAWGIVVLAGVVVVGWRRGRLGWPAVVAAAGLVLFAAAAERNAFPAALLLLPPAARALQGVEWPVFRAPSPVLGGTIAAAVVVVAATMLWGGSSIDEERFPEVIAADLVPVATFHDDRAGGYLIYRFGREFAVFIDDRAELYGADRLQAHLDARNGIGWMELFEQHGIVQALVRSDEALLGTLEAAGWTRVAQEPGWALLRP